MTTPKNDLKLYGKMFNSKMTMKEKLATDKRINQDRKEFEKARLSK